MRSADLENWYYLFGRNISWVAWILVSTGTLGCHCSKPMDDRDIRLYPRLDYR